MSKHIDLSAYIDNALNTKDKTTAENHLKTCDSCRDQLKDLQAAIAWMKKHPRAEAPRGLDTRILARLRAQDQKSIRRPWMWGISSALATGLVVCLVMITHKEIRPVADMNQAFRSEKSESKQIEHNFGARLDQVQPMSPAPRQREKEVMFDKKIIEADAPSLAKNKFESSSENLGAPRDAVRRSSFDQNAGLGGSTPLQWQGISCAIKKRTTQVIRNQKDWEILWKKAFPDSSSVPVVDFSLNHVWAVFAGEGRYSNVQIFPPEIKNGKQVVRYRFILGPSTARPYSLLTVPVSTVPVEFQNVD